MPEPAPYRVTARNIDPTSDNRIHSDDVAQQFGFTAALVPGVELFAYLTHPLAEAWGAEFLTRGAIDVQFRRPVYDAEVVTAIADGGDDAAYRIRLVGTAGDERAVGSARPQAPEPAPAVDGFRPVAATSSPPPADETSLRPGTALGTVTEHVDRDALVGYLDAIGEHLDVFRGGVVHPGGLLRMVNAALLRNVALGPWIHTGSDCRLLGIARVPTTLTADAVVTDRFERKGRSWVRYDALVRADGVPVLLAHHTAIYDLGHGQA